MWFKHYRDYPVDQYLKKEQVESGRGIIGCEMHELNGWGTDWHYTKRKKGRFGTLLARLIFFWEKS